MAHDQVTLRQLAPARALHGPCRLASETYPRVGKTHMKQKTLDIA